MDAKDFKEEGQLSTDLKKKDEADEKEVDFGTVRPNCFDPDDCGINFIGCR